MDIVVCGVADVQKEATGNAQKKIRKFMKSIYKGAKNTIWCIIPVYMLKACLRQKVIGGT